MIAEKVKRIAKDYRTSISDVIEKALIFGLPEVEKLLLKR